MFLGLGLIGSFVSADLQKQKPLLIGPAAGAACGVLVAGFEFELAGNESLISVSLYLIPALLLLADNLPTVAWRGIYPLLGFIHGVPHGHELPVSQSPVAVLLGVVLGLCGITAVGAILGKVVRLKLDIARSQIPIALVMLAGALLVTRPLI